MRATELFTGGFKMMKTYSSTAWLLIIPLFVFNFLVQLYSTRAQSRIMEQAIADPTVVNPFGFFGPLLLTLLISMLFASVVAVGWHRRALLNESFSWSPSHIFRKPVLSYFIGILLIVLFCVIVGMVGGSLIGFIGGFLYALARSTTFFVVVPLAIAFILFVLVVTYRLSLTLPARAIEKPLSLSDAWNATKGQGWMLVRFSLIYIIVLVIFMLPFFWTAYTAQMDLQNAMLSGELTDQAARLAASKPSILASVFGALFGAVGGLYNIGILTILYATFVSNDKSIEA